MAVCLVNPWVIVINHGSPNLLSLYQKLSVNI